MKRTLLTLYALLVSVLASAAEVIIDGVKYNTYTDGTVYVSGYTANVPSNLVIPSVITYNGNDYSVTEISIQAFYDCIGLTSVTIPGSVTSVGDYAFYGCSALAEIKSLNPTPPTIKSSTFSGVDKETCKLLVTKGNLVYYWLDPVWKEFLNMSDDLLGLDVIPRAKYGDTPIDLTASLPEGVELVFESTNNDVARVEGNKLQIVGAGEATITASVPDGGAPMEIIGQMRQFIVDKADLTITAENYEIKAGDAMPEFELLFDGLVNDDTEADIAELPVVECDATDTNTPGEYEIRLVGGTDRNYNISCVAGKLTINKADGIEEILSASKHSDVYNLHGVRVMTKASSKDLKQLPAGIYIIKGKKVVIR